MNLWRLDCGAQTVLVGGNENLAEVFYWGKLLPEAENLKAIWDITRLDYSVVFWTAFQRFQFVRRFPKHSLGILE